MKYTIEVTAYPKTYEVEAKDIGEAKYKATQLADKDGKWLSYTRKEIKE